jgi:hypothetical protein
VFKHALLIPVLPRAQRANNIFEVPGEKHIHQGGPPCFRACARGNPGRKSRKARDFPGQKNQYYTLPEEAWLLHQGLVYVQTSLLPLHLPLFLQFLPPYLPFFLPKNAHRRDAGTLGNPFIPPILRKCPKIPVPAKRGASAVSIQAPQAFPLPRFEGTRILGPFPEMGGDAARMKKPDAYSLSPQLSQAERQKVGQEPE